MQIGCEDTKNLIMYSDFMKMKMSSDYTTRDSFGNKVYVRWDYDHLEKVRRHRKLREMAVWVRSLLGLEE